METGTVQSPVKVTKERLFNYGLVIALSIIWGLAFVAIRRAVLELSPVSLTILRWLIASGGFLILAPVFGKPKKPIERRHIPRILLVSFASVVGYHLSLNYAETIVSSGLAGLLISFGPIFAVLLSALFLKEKVGRRLIFALALAFSGAAILSIAADPARSHIGSLHVQPILRGFQAPRERIWRPTHGDLGCGNRHSLHTPLGFMESLCPGFRSLAGGMAFRDLPRGPKYSVR